MWLLEQVKALNVVVEVIVDFEPLALVFWAANLGESCGDNVYVAGEGF
jgi:hypothetical protein